MIGAAVHRASRTCWHLFHFTPQFPAARRLPGVRVALTSCRPWRRVGTASRRSCSQSRHSCSQSEHEKREWEHGRRRVGAGERRLGRQAGTLGAQGHLFHLHPNSVFGTRTMLRGACNNAVAVLATHTASQASSTGTALCLARVASLPRVASGARCLPALLALLRCPPCTACLPPPPALPARPALPA